MRENSAKSGITEDAFEHNGAICYNVDVPNIGPARAIVMTLLQLTELLKLPKKIRMKIQSSIF